MHKTSLLSCCLSLLLVTACGYSPQVSREEDAGGQGGSTGAQVSGTGRTDAGLGLDGARAQDGGTTRNHDASRTGDARPVLPDAPFASDGATGGSRGSGGTVAGGSTSKPSTLGGTTGTGGTLVKLDAGVRPPDAALADAPVIVICPALALPLHGDLSKTSSNVGGVATYTCLPGYGTPNPATRTCQADGTWSGTEPTCVAVNCGAPPKPDNGSVQAPSTIFEAKATYACDAYYGIVGEANRTCQANGTWSGTAPTCRCAQSMCDGICVDLKTDNRHCGACNKSCSASLPSTAQCTPTGCLVTLANGMTPGDIIVDATSVYWTDSNAGDAGSVNKIAIGGGTAVTLVSGEKYPGSLAVDATNLYWASWNDEAVKKVPKGGGPVTTLSTGENGPCCLVLNATDLYYRSTRGIVRLPLAGGPSSTLPSSYGPGFALALDATSVYWRVDIAGGITAQLLTMPLDASSDPVSLTTSSSMGAIVVDASNIYWTMPAGTVAGAGALAKMPLAGGTSPVTLASGLNEPTDLAVDGTHVYFTSYQDGTVTKIPLAGGASTVIASKQKLPSAIVVDGTSVYWTNYGGSSAPTGAVMKLSPK